MQCKKSKCRSLIFFSLAASCLLPALAVAGGKEELFEVNRDEYLRQVDACVRNAEESLRNNALRDARAMARLVESKVSKSKYISHDWRKRYKGRIEQILLDAKNKEDSLVARNIDILKSEGITAALDFKLDRLHKCGVSEEKLALVDEAIAKAGASGERFENTTISRPALATGDDTQKKKGILMKNGTLISGRVVAENENFLRIETQGSPIRILKKLVESIDGVPYDNKAGADSTSL